jgi:hypothetical protein
MTWSDVDLPGHAIFFHPLDTFAGRGTLPLAGLGECSAAFGDISGSGGGASFSTSILRSLPLRKVSSFLDTFKTRTHLLDFLSLPPIQFFKLRLVEGRSCVCSPSLALPTLLR